MGQGYYFYSVKTYKIAIYSQLKLWKDIGCYFPPPEVTAYVLDTIFME